jgi:flagellar motor switch protein FliN
MSLNFPEIVNRVSGLQPQIWQTVSQVVSEACGQSIELTTPLTIGTHSSDLMNELGSPMLVIQFAFASSPESTQVILLPQDTFADLSGLVKGEHVQEVDDNLVSDMRDTLEAFVQGICLAVGILRNEPVVATGLTIRFQLLNMPVNLQRAEQVIRSQVALTHETFSGTAIWLGDATSAEYLLGSDPDEEEVSTPFAQIGPSHQESASKAQEESNGLELLLDIPLEITVELGRVKMLVKDVVELGTGSIVEIDKAAGEPVDVLVNGRLVAKGEVVVIEDNFGVRITEIINTQDRLGRLGEVA